MAGNDFVPHYSTLATTEMGDLESYLDTLPVPERSFELPPRSPQTVDFDPQLFVETPTTHLIRFL
jgi:hypothetical protein